jgi:hypothetical protein
MTFPFLGFDKTTWDFINSFSNWFSAIGTIGAVIVSLYLARGRSRIKLHISAGHRILAGLGTGKFPDYVSISIVNRGFRKVRITGIGWKVGLFNKQYADQIVNNLLWSSPLPIELEDGQEAKYLVPFKGAADWLNSFARDFLSTTTFPNLTSHFVTLQVFTSAGKTFEKRIEENLRKKLIEAVETIKTKPPSVTS